MADSPFANAARLTGVLGGAALRPVAGAGRLGIRATLAVVGGVRALPRRAVSGALEGPMVEAVTREVIRHRVLERVTGELVASEAVGNVTDTVLAGNTPRHGLGPGTRRRRGRAGRGPSPRRPGARAGRELRARQPGDGASGGAGRGEQAGRPGDGAPAGERRTVAVRGRDRPQPGGHGRDCPAESWASPIRWPAACGRGLAVRTRGWRPRSSARCAGRNRGEPRRPPLRGARPDLRPGVRLRDLRARRTGLPGAGNAFDRVRDRWGDHQRGGDRGGHGGRARPVGAAPAGVARPDTGRAGRSKLPARGRSATSWSSGRPPGKPPATGSCGFACAWPTAARRRAPSGRSCGCGH